MIHRVRRVDSEQWRPIWTGIVSRKDFTYIASTYRPGSGPGGSNQEPDGTINVPAEKWCQVFTTSTAGDGSNTAENGFVVADAIANSFATTNPGLIAFDELNSKTNVMVNALSNRMANVYPQYNGRWGIYLVAGTSTNWKSYQGAIVEAMKSNAKIFAEFYIKYEDYCGSGSTQDKKDAYLKTRIVGNGIGRMKWLVNIREALNSGSQIVPIFSVTDPYFDGPDPFKMLDRVFYAFTQSGYVSFLRHNANSSVNKGGAGSWKWDNQDEEGGLKLNIGRAEQFVESWDWYCDQNKTTPRPKAGIPGCKGAGNNARIKEGGAGNSPPGWTRTNYRDKEYQLKDKANMIEKPDGNNGVAYLFKSKTKFQTRKVKGDRQEITEIVLNTNNPTRDKGSYFALYVNEVVYGLGAKGAEATSKYYTRFYPMAYDQRPIYVRGVCIDEKEYGELGEWIRESQVDVSRQVIAHINLLIPSTGVNVWGFIDNFNMKVDSKNHGIPVAPEWEFNFIPILDETDPDFPRGAPSRVLVPFFDQDSELKAKFDDFSSDYLSTLAYNLLESDIKGSIPNSIEIIKNATNKIAKKNENKGTFWSQWFEDHKDTHNPWGES